MKNPLSFFVIGLLVLCMAGSSVLLGQAVNGTILGTISDASGATVSGAKITATEVNTGISRNTTTSRAGQYVLNNMPPGVYKIEVEQVGFRKGVQENVDVQVNSTVRADLALQIGQVSEQIVVTAEVGQLQTDRTDTGRKVEVRQISQLPLTQNRNFQGLLNLVPGAARAQRFHSEFFNSNDSLQSRVNGQSRLANNVQFEGIDNNHRTGLLTALIPPVEALQTVDITTSNYEAELGRAGGAVTNVNLKSGTNDIHGSAYYFNRVSRLAAKRTDLATKPVTVYNYFGFTVGGPIIKNKTFYFGDYLRVTDRLGKGHRLTLPTPEFRAGNFSGGPTTIYDPASTSATDGRGRTAFAGNIIPQSRISELARRMLAKVPNPTLGGLGVNFEAATTRIKDTDNFDVKVDHNFNDANRLSVRYSFQRPELTDPAIAAYGLAGGPANGGFAGTGVTKTQSAALNFTRVMSPTLITELRVGIMRYRNDAQNSDLATKASDEIGVRGVNISDFTGGLVGIDITGYSNPVIGYSASLPWVRFETNWNVVNNWTKTFGSHTLKFGVDWRFNRDGLLQTQTFSPRGLFRFRPGQTALNGGPASGFANAFAAFLLDQPNDYGRDLPVIFPEYVQFPFFSYVQDKWQVNQRLTVDIGIRHEFWPPAKPRLAGGFSNYDPSTNSLVIAGVGGNPSNLGRETYYTFFAPRIGISYRLNEKTVIRSGYGVSYMPFPDNSYAYNFPVRQNNAFNPLNSFVAAGRMADGFPAPQPATIPSNGIIANAPAQNYDVIPKTFKEGYIQSYNLAVQRALPFNFTMDVAFVGNVGRRVPTVQNLNAGLLLGAGAAGQPLFNQFRRTADTNQRFTGTSTSYNSMQVKFDRRFSGGFQLTTAYTWSKSIDYTNDNGGYWVYINPERSRAASNFDRRHMFNQSYLWELPFGKGNKWVTSGPMAMILGGWQVNGILTMMSGAPFTITAPGALLNAPGNTQTANYVGTGGLNTPKEVSFGRGAKWFDVTQFALPAQNTFGNTGRNAFRGPAFFNLDFSVFRKFQIKEKITTELRFESFNFTNTPQYPNPVGGIDSPNFGQIVNANIGDTADPGSRQVQLGLRIIF